MKKTIMVLAFILLLVGCASTAEKDKKIDDMQIQITKMEEQISSLKTLVETSNIYGNGIYYSQNPKEGIESIEFISSTLIRVFGRNEYKGIMRNNYYIITSTGEGKYKITGEILMHDTRGEWSYAQLKQQWDSAVLNYHIMETMEISADHQTLFYGPDHNIDVAKFNGKIAY